MSIEDQKAKLRQYRYTAASIITVAGPAIALALAEGGVSKWIAAAVAVGGAVTGAGGLAAAANKTRTQRADGMFEPTPELPVLTPSEHVQTGLNQATTNAASALSELEKIREATVAGLNAAPVLGPLTARVNDVVGGK